MLGAIAYLIKRGRRRKGKLGKRKAPKRAEVTTKLIYRENPSQNPLSELHHLPRLPSIYTSRHAQGWELRVHV